MRWIVVLLVIAAGCKRAQPVDPPPAEAKPKENPVVKPQLSMPTVGWKPDPKLLDKLDAPLEFAGYTIRPPKGYEIRPSGVQPADPNISQERIENMDIFTPARKGATSTSIHIDVIVLPNPEDPKRAPEHMLTEWISFTLRLREKIDDFAKLNGLPADKWSHSPLEKGAIGDLAFVRTRHCDQNSRGVRYTGMDGARMLTINISTSQNETADDLETAHTAVMTLQRK